MLTLISDVSGSKRLFSDVIRKLGNKLDGDELYEEFQRIYDESVSRDAEKEKAEIRCGIGAEEGDSSACIYNNKILVK